MKARLLVAYRGPSLIDGRPIRVVVYALAGTKNRKLGRMVLVLVCNDDLAPHEAAKIGVGPTVAETRPAATARPSVVETGKVVSHGR